MFVGFTRTGRAMLDGAIPHAPAHFAPLLMAVRDQGATFTLVAQSRRRFEVPEAGTAIVIIGDDMAYSMGPLGFRIRSLLTQMVAVAELEAGLISARTKAALAVVKERRKVEGKPGLGGFRGRKATEADGAAGVAAIKAKASARATDLSPIVAAIRASGITSARGIAKALTDQGIGTARGSGTWTTTQVSRLIARLDG